MYKLLSLFLAGLLLVSCRKDDIIECYPTTTGPTSPPTSSISLNSFFSKYGAPIQRKGFLLGQNQPISSTYGTQLSVSNVTFLFDNNTAAQDSAYLYLREVHQVADMVLSDMPTWSRDGQVLISGGEFYIQVRKPDGQRLHVSPTVSNSTLPTLYTPVPPEQDITPQKLWQTSISGGAWTPINNAAPVRTDTLRSPIPVAPSIIRYRAQIPLDTVSYLNIDQLWRAYQGTSLATVSVAVPTTTSSETRVWLRPVGFNGLFRATSNSASNNITSYYATLPVGTSLKAVVLQSINGQLYYGTQTFTVQNGLALTPTLTPVSEAEAVQLIRQL